MKCSHPMSLPRPNGSGSSDRISVPCGKCMNCLSKLRSQWSFRLKHELRHSQTAFFVTLTYSDDNLPINSLGYSELSKRHVQLFLKRLRREIEKVSQNAPKGPKFKYYIVGEYGTETIRPHYHGILFNLPLCNPSRLLEASQLLIRDSWTYGNIQLGTVTDASINYTTKYCITHHETIENRCKPFSLISTKPAIGIDYIAEQTLYHLQTKKFHGTIEGGKKVSLPRYYRDKIFNTHQIAVNTAVTKKKDEELRKSLDERLKKLGHEPIMYEIIQQQQNEKILKNRLTKNSKL